MGLPLQNLPGVGNGGGWVGHCLEDDRDIQEHLIKPY